MLQVGFDESRKGQACSTGAFVRDAWPRRLSCFVLFCCVVFAHGLVRRIGGSQLRGRFERLAAFARALTCHPCHICTGTGRTRHRPAGLANRLEPAAAARVPCGWWRQLPREAAHIRQRGSRSAAAHRRSECCSVRVRSHRRAGAVRSVCEGGAKGRRRCGVPCRLASGWACACRCAYAGSCRGVYHRDRAPACTAKDRLRSTAARG